MTRAERAPRAGVLSMLRPEPRCVAETFHPPVGISRRLDRVAFAGAVPAEALYRAYGAMTR